MKACCQREFCQVKPEAKKIEDRKNFNLDSYIKNYVCLLQIDACCILFALGAFRRALLGKRFVHGVFDDS